MSLESAMGIPIEVSIKAKNEQTWKRQEGQFQALFECKDGCEPNFAVMGEDHYVVESGFVMVLVMVIAWATMLANMNMEMDLVVIK